MSYSMKKKIKLKLTPGENIRDEIIKAVIKATEQSCYTACNKIEKLVEIVSKDGNFVDRGNEFVGGGKTAASLSRIVFKITNYIASGNIVWTAMCLMSGTSETISFGCSTIKIIPFRGRLYVGAKIVSKGWMSYRNICAGEE